MRSGGNAATRILAVAPGDRGRGRATGPFLTGMDALIAAVGRELGTSVVSADGDLTHEATKRVIDVEGYRD